MEILADFLAELDLLPLLPVFTENCIDDVASLQQLVLHEEDSFKLLCPLVGQRLKIKQKLNCYNKPDITTTKVLHGHMTNDNIIIEDITSDFTTDFTTNEETPEISEEQSIIITALDEEPAKTFTTSEVPVLVEPKTFTENLRQFDVGKALLPNEYPGLKQLLQNDITGRAIIAIYDIDGELDTLCQGYICQILVGFFLNLVPFIRLNNEHFNYLSNEIISLFPTENREVYYIAPVRKRNSRDNTSGFAKGKLVDKYKNKLNFLRRAQLLPSRRSSIKDPITLNVPEESFEEQLNFLKNNTEPWEEVVSYWVQCRNYRKRIFSDKSTDLQLIFTHFPILLKSIGHKLILLDFKDKFPDNTELIYTNFESAYTSLVTIKAKLLSPADVILQQALGNPGIEQESKHFFMLTLLCSMIPLRTNPGKKSPRVTSQQIRDSLIRHVTLPGDIERVVEEHSQNSKQPSLPFIIVEGPSYNNIKNVYVSFHNVLYTPPNILKALDIRFTIYHVLILKYPLECEHIWLFIQRAVYLLKTQFDNIPAIIDLANKVALRMKSRD